MTDPTPSTSKRRWVASGEIVAVAALIISALGLWNGWRSGPDKPAAVVETRSAVPLTLRGVATKDGRALLIEPAENSHALDSATLSLTSLSGASAFDLAGDAQIDASDIERAIDKAQAAEKEKAGDGLHRLPVSIDARYVEAGQTRRSRARYALTYRWVGGGLFGGRSLRLAGLSLVARGR